MTNGTDNWNIFKQALAMIALAWGGWVTIEVVELVGFQNHGPRWSLVDQRKFAAETDKRMDSIEQELLKELVLIRGVVGQHLDNHPDDLLRQTIKEHIKDRYSHFNGPERVAP